MDTKPEKKVQHADLSNEACFALAYCRAVLASKAADNSRVAADYVAEYTQLLELAKKQFTQHDLDGLKRKGIEQLAQLGVIDTKRDGNGDLQPTRLYLDRIEVVQRRILADDLQ